MKNTGYFQMPRWLLESPVIRNEYEETAVVRLYSRAKYEDEWVMHKGHKILLHRGDVATAPGEFIKQLRGDYWTKDKMDTFWKRLEREGWIKIKTIPSVTTIISITHYVGVEKRLGTDLSDTSATTRKNLGMERVSGDERLGADSAEARNLRIYNKGINKEDNNSSDDDSSKSEKDEQSEVSIFEKKEKTGRKITKAKKSSPSPKVMKSPTQSVVLTNLFYDMYKDRFKKEYPKCVNSDLRNMDYLLKQVESDLEKAKQVISTFFETEWITEFTIYSIVHQKILPKIVAYADKKNSESDKEERIKQINLSQGKSAMGFTFKF